ncbi:MAG: histidine kinase [Salinivirgaceae bacterium]|jgi:two-component system LytT family sensor kinase|nr:histidine kinase [Salinivirgaceae bacterium]
MKNPITQSFRNILIYIALWLVILGIHVATLTLMYNLTWIQALIDGIVFDTVFALLGMALWYPVFYNDIEKHTITNLIINHISILALTLVFWISISVFILKTIVFGQDSYLGSLDNGIAWRVFTGIFFYFALVMVYYLIIYGYNLREHIMQESHLREKINEAELQTLKSQINPHFLFNSLNSISSLTITNPEKAHEMIIKLSGFLRYSLAHDPNNLIPLKKEIENMEAYISVEKIRFGDKLIFENEINDNRCEHKVPFLILQPLIENAIKHGVYESTEPITVKVACREIDGKKIEITIENGFDPNAVPRRGTGTGIKNIKERLKIIYQLSDLLTFEKGENYFKVTLVIPDKPAFKTKN